MPTIRERSSGTFELIVKHRMLLKPYSSTHDTRPDAEAYGAKLVALLDRGEIPPELAVQTDQPIKLSIVLRDYQREAPIAESDRPLVKWLQENVAVDVAGINVRWVDSWVNDMKTRRLVPSSIRKRVESLARAIDWWNRKHSREVVNPLRTLPRGYSKYHPDVEDAPTDAARDRRLPWCFVGKLKLILSASLRVFDDPRACIEPGSKACLGLQRRPPDADRRLRRHVHHRS